MAIIAGARTFHQVRATVRAGFWPVMRVSWITSPICLAFAQQFLPEQVWVPFFNLVAFIIGSMFTKTNKSCSCANSYVAYINTRTKKKRLAALRKKVSLSSTAALSALTFSQYNDDRRGDYRPGY